MKKENEIKSTGTHGFIDSFDMYKVVEAIQSGKQVPLDTVFEEINWHCYSTLTQLDANGTLIKMEVDHYKKYGDVHEFSQNGGIDNIYCLRESDVVSYEAKVFEWENFLLIDCILKNSSHMKIVVHNISEYMRYMEVDPISAYKFQNMLDKQECSYVDVKILNMSGFTAEMRPKSVDIVEKTDEFFLILSDAVGSSMKVPLGNNPYECKIYSTDDAEWSYVVVKPEGIPFVEIHLMLMK